MVDETVDKMVALKVSSPVEQKAEMTAELRAVTSEDEMVATWVD